MKSLLLSCYVAKLPQQQHSMQLSLAEDQDYTCSASDQAAISHHPVRARLGVQQAYLAIT